MRRRWAEGGGHELAAHPEHLDRVAAIFPPAAALVVASFAAVFAATPAAAHVPEHCDRREAHVANEALVAAWEAISREGMTPRNLDRLLGAYNRRDEALLRWVECIVGETESS